MLGGTKGTLCSLLLPPLLFLLLHATGTHAHGGMIENEYSSDLFYASWEIDNMDMIAEFYIKAKLTESNAWMAVGFKESTKSSKDFDVILAYNGTVTDRWADAPVNFTLDTDLGGTNDVSETNFTHQNGYIEATFTRKLNTGDKKDFDLESKPLVIFWACGKYSGTVLNLIDSGEEEISFYPDMEDEASQLKTHGILMVFVVMVFMTSGMLLSRYMKTVFYWWFYFHAAIFVFSLVFIIISTIIIFQAHDNMFRTSVHSVFGLFFIIAMGSQSLLGLLSHLQFDKKRLVPPTFPDKTHWWLGRASFFIGIIAVLLGFSELHARRLAWNSFWLFLILIFFFILTLEKYVGQTHEVAAKGIAEDDEAFDTRDDDDLMYVPKKGNSLSIGKPAKQLSMKELLKIVVPFSLGIGLLFILVAVGIGTTTE